MIQCPRGLRLLSWECRKLPQRSGEGRSQAGWWEWRESRPCSWRQGFYFPALGLGLEIVAQSWASHPSAGGSLGSLWVGNRLQLEVTESLARPQWVQLQMVLKLTQ